MQTRTLDEWLSWQESLNPAEIDLGLARVEQVLAQAGLSDTFDCPLIIVAGTNGKGSVVATLQAIASAAGYKVACYTSPHLLRYNERITIDGQAVSDDALCAAFERIDQARADVSLTYFEFGTLAAVDVFHRAGADLVIMEIGLGGRLDAVNVMQPDVSVITSIALDHTDWLGDSRAAIATEKAGVMRSGKVTVTGESQPPDTLLQHAAKTAAIVKRIEHDFQVQADGQQWSLQSDKTELTQLPLPVLPGAHQLNNAACAIVALQQLQAKLVIELDYIRQGLVQVQLAGRCQLLRRASQTTPEVLADVAHNPQAVAALVEHCRSHPVAGKTVLVLAMLADKPIPEIALLLTEITDEWHICGLEHVNRGCTREDLARQLEQVIAGVKLSAHATVELACAAALHDTDENDRLLITGSFYTVADGLRYFETQP